MNSFTIHIILQFEEEQEQEEHCELEVQHEIEDHEQPEHLLYPGLTLLQVQIPSHLSHSP